MLIKCFNKKALYVECLWERKSASFAPRERFAKLWEGAGAIALTRHIGFVQRSKEGRLLLLSEFDDNLEYS